MLCSEACFPRPPTCTSLGNSDTLIQGLGAVGGRCGNQWFVDLFAFVHFHRPSAQAHLLQVALLGSPTHKEPSSQTLYWCGRPCRQCKAKLQELTNAVSPPARPRSGLFVDDPSSFLCPVLLPTSPRRGQRLTGRPCSWPGPPTPALPRAPGAATRNSARTAGDSWQRLVWPEPCRHSFQGRVTQFRLSSTGTRALCSLVCKGPRPPGRLVSLWDPSQPVLCPAGSHGRPAVGKG